MIGFPGVRGMREKSPKCFEPERISNRSLYLRGMGQTTAFEAAKLKSELSRLYQRLILVDDLIKSLERYSALARPRPAKPRKAVTSLPVRRIA